VDVRDSANPALARARRWLARVNARHPWNHNEHFHGWILRNLPARRRAAVDVGCGTGVLAGKLAPHFARVTGIDADAGMAAAASVRLAQDPRVTILRCRFGQFAAKAGDGGADLITMVAVLHHLDLDDTLARIPALLAPGGRLLVVGLARVNSLPDLAADLISATANLVMGLIKHPRRARPAGGPAIGQPVMPVRDPATTLVRDIPPIRHEEAMGLAAAEYDRFGALLRGLAPGDWDTPTVCDQWDVRAVAAHVLGAAEACASVRENIHQMRLGHQVQRQLGLGHIVHGANEIQVRDRAGLLAHPLPL
jgi:SAM-dependent methyltransferase